MTRNNDAHCIWSLLDQMSQLNETGNVIENQFRYKIVEYLKLFEIIIFSFFKLCWESMWASLGISTNQNKQCILLWVLTILFSFTSVWINFSTLTSSRSTVVDRFFKKKLFFLSDRWRLLKKSRKKNNFGFSWLSTNTQNSRNWTCFYKK